MVTRAALAAASLASGVLLTGCSGSGSGSQAPSRPTTFEGNQPIVRTTVCGQLVSTGDVPLTSVVHDPVTLHDQKYATRVFVFTDTCDAGPRVSIQPRRCGISERSATATNGSPVAMLIHGLCSYSLRLNGRLAANVVVK